MSTSPETGPGTASAEQASTPNPEDEIVTRDEPEGDEHTNTRTTTEGVETEPDDGRPTPSDMPHVDAVPEIPRVGGM